MSRIASGQLSQKGGIGAGGTGVVNMLHIR